MTDERTLRTADAATACGAEWAILTSPDALYYAAQVDTNIETGPSPFAGGPALAIVGRDGTLAVVVNNLDEPAARASAADHVTVYPGMDLHDRTLVESRFPRRHGRGAECARRGRHGRRPGGQLPVVAGRAARRTGRDDRSHRRRAQRAALYEDR